MNERTNEQEAEASVGKLLCSFVDDGLESEPVEEYGKRWTSHTAAYDDDFGHMRMAGFSSYACAGYGSKFRERRGSARGGFLRRERAGGEPSSVIYY